MIWEVTITTIDPQEGNQRLFQTKVANADSIDELDYAEYLADAGLEGKDQADIHIRVRSRFES